LAFLLGVPEMMNAPAAAQVQTDLPPAVAGARPAVIERVSVHSDALEGNSRVTPSIAT
jgi:hypothetical protein